MRDQRQAVNLGGRRDKCIRDAHRPAPKPGYARRPSPGVGDRYVDRRDSTFEAEWQFIAQPIIESFSAIAGRQPFDPEAQLGQGHDADEHSILVSVREPGNYAGIGIRLDPLRHHVGVEQKFIGQLCADGP